MTDTTYDPETTMYRQSDAMGAAFIVFIVAVLGAALVFMLATIPDTVEPGLGRKIECSKKAAIVDIPGDAQGPIEGYLCKMVNKGSDD